jgi:hypothetical protein
VLILNKAILQFIFRHPSYSRKSSEQLFREWNVVDFPKPTTIRFGKSVSRNERNNRQLLFKGADFSADF